MYKKIQSSEFLYKNALDKDERMLVDKMAYLVNKNPDNYYLTDLWKYDSKIGGIGAYCMSADPIKNPFKGGFTRQLFRPLQYARSEIDILDLRYTTRHVIQNMGLHLEFLLKYILQQNTIFSGVIYNRETLGCLIKKAYEKNLIDGLELETLNEILAMYNHSKHGVNMDEDKESSFSVNDAICYYISCRKISNKLLDPYYNEVYKELKSIGILERLHINYENKDDFDFVI